MKDRIREEHTQEYEHQHIYAEISNANDRQEEIANVLGFNKSRIVKDIAELAKYCYGTERVINYGKYTEIETPQEEDLEVKHKEFLYTLMQYEGNDILLHIGTGEFTPEVFTRRNIPELAALSHSSLPLFVVPASAKQYYEWEEKEIKYKNAIVMKFLNEHAIIYSPKGGEAVDRTKTDGDIRLGDSTGQIQPHKVIEEFQRLAIDKAIRIFKNQEKEKEMNGEKSEVVLDAITKEKVLEEIGRVQRLSREDFKKWQKRGQKRHSHRENIVLMMLEKIIGMEKYIGEVDAEKKIAAKMRDIIMMFTVKNPSAK